MLPWGNRHQFSGKGKIQFKEFTVNLASRPFFATLRSKANRALKSAGGQAKSNHSHAQGGYQGPIAFELPIFPMLPAQKHHSMDKNEAEVKITVPGQCRAG